MKFPHCFPHLVLALFCLNLSIAQINTNPNALDLTPKNGENHHIQKGMDSNKHQTLLAAFKSTEMEGLLDNEVPLTIFAPSDMAFSKLAPTKLQDLLNSDDKDMLKAVLKYHIVAGKLTASKILKALCRGQGKATFTTIQGNKIIATMRGLDIVLTDAMGNSAKITAADATRGNGIVHEIDSVILPTSI